jgi:hypothetical protein
MLSVEFFLVVSAFIVVIASASGKVPLWIAVLLLTLVHLLALLGR